MSKPLTLFQKFKLFKAYLNMKEDGVIVDCACCGSVNIKFKNQFSETVYHSDNHTKKGKILTIYYSEYICNDCGAKCVNRQEWSPATQ